MLFIDLFCLFRCFKVCLLPEERLCDQYTDLFVKITRSLPEDVWQYLRCSVPGWGWLCWQEVIGQFQGCGLLVSLAWVIPLIISWAFIYSIYSGVLNLALSACGCVVVPRVYQDHTLSACHEGKCLEGSLLCWDGLCWQVVVGQFHGDGLLVSLAWVIPLYHELLLTLFIQVFQNWHFMPVDEWLCLGGSVPGCDWLCWQGRIKPYMPADG